MQIYLNAKEITEKLKEYFETEYRPHIQIQIYWDAKVFTAQISE